MILQYNLQNPFINLYIVEIFLMFANYVVYIPKPNNISSCRKYCLAFKVYIYSYHQNGFLKYIAVCFRVLLILALWLHKFLFWSFNFSTLVFSGLKINYSVFVIFSIGVNSNFLNSTSEPSA